MSHMTSFLHDGHCGAHAGLRMRLLSLHVLYESTDSGHDGEF